MKNDCFLTSKAVICRICGKKTKIGVLKKHSDICKDNQELKKDDKLMVDALNKYYLKTRKFKKHFISKIQLNKLILLNFF